RVLLDPELLDWLRRLVTIPHPPREAARRILDVEDLGKDRDACGRRPLRVDEILRLYVALGRTDLERSAPRHGAEDSAHPSSGDDGARTSIQHRSHEWEQARPRDDERRRDCMQKRHDRDRRDGGAGEIGGIEPSDAARLRTDEQHAHGAPQTEERYEDAA